MCRYEEIILLCNWPLYLLGPSGPKESSGWSPRFPPVRAGTTKGQRSHARRPPLGQPQLNVPRERSRPRGRPLQPRFPKEHHHRRAADDSLCGLVPQSNVVVSLEMERRPSHGHGDGPTAARALSGLRLVLRGYTATFKLKVCMFITIGPMKKL